MDNHIYTKENIDLFTEYGHGVDSIQHVLHSIGYTFENIDRRDTRNHGLSIIKKLLKNDIIYVTHWGKCNEVLQILDLNLDQTMIYIKNMWNEGANHLELENIINFSFQKWYLNALKNEGIDENTDWEWFGKNFLPNFPEWIKKNKPSSTKNS